MPTDMTATSQRDQAIRLAKTDTQKALAKARVVSDPWFRAQALSWTARFANESPQGIAGEAATAAAICRDDYQRSAVRSWEIAALAERKCLREARAALKESAKIARCVVPPSSRSEAILLLLQAAFLIGCEEAETIGEMLTEVCSATDHWRCKRALRDASQLLDGSRKPRVFFW